MTRALMLHRTFVVHDSAAEHFDRCMDVWVAWMQHGGEVRGFSSLDSTCGRAQSNFSVADDDADIVYDKADKRLAEAVNACVESLRPASRQAILIRYGMATLWPFVRLDREAETGQAMATLRVLVERRC